RRSLKLSGRRTRSSVSGVGGGIFCESNHRSKNQSGTGQRRSCHRRGHNCRACAGIGRERKRQPNRGPWLHPFEDRSSASIAVCGRIAHLFARAGGEPSRFAQRIFANGTNSCCLSRSDREKISLARIRRFEPDFVEERCAINRRQILSSTSLRTGEREDRDKRRVIP